ncbi:hypothetical protein OGAPHI_003298 [Ogataea philodendri]|uniref:Uncharacterized protein n=1 Tax=Ogataea philodendri TaxID=1378263 RepID=A0A9P8P8E3_9ASCO|nr:uncharacterized protein OGAPHI_003298 [Ogataea philodendri]KAH3666849.1 hypothetical protein OGAPHI_003298 [Ogataea philodendri]
MDVELKPDTMAVILEKLRSFINLSATITKYLIFSALACRSRCRRIMWITKCVIWLQFLIKLAMLTNLDKHECLKIRPDLYDLARRSNLSILWNSSNWIRVSCLASSVASMSLKRNLGAFLMFLPNINGIGGR